MDAHGSILALPAVRNLAAPVENPSPRCDPIMLNSYSCRRIRLCLTRVDYNSRPSAKMSVMIVINEGRRQLSTMVARYGEPDPRFRHLFPSPPPDPRFGNLFPSPLPARVSLKETRFLLGSEVLNHRRRFADIIPNASSVPQPVTLG